MKAQNFKNLNEILKYFHLEFMFEKFIDFYAISTIEPDAKFKKDLDFALANRGEEDKEAFVSEFIIVPFLKEIWERHSGVNLFSHVSVSLDDLTLIPDYLLAAKTSTGLKTLDKPLLLTIEAKNEKFDEGWFQALLQLIACQKMNETDSIPVYAIVTTGDTWQFGKLERGLFIRHPVPVSLDKPEKLFGILDYLFAECEKNSERFLKSEQ